MFETIGLRRGEIRTRDLRSVYGDGLNELDYVDVVVISEEGVPQAARITLTMVSFGSAHQRAFICPSCQEPRHLLLARRGKIQCSTCHRRRSRRQKEHHFAAWNRLGGRQEDQLVRLLLRPTRPTPARMHQATRLAHLLLNTDRVRAAQLREELNALMTAVQSRV